MHTRTFAAELNLPNTKVNPDKHLLYSVKRLMEKAVEITKLDKDSKADYYKDLTLNRLAELKYVVENKLLSEVEQSTQRISFQTGILSDYVSRDNELAKKREEIRNLLLSSKDLIVPLRDKYPANSSYWMLVQHNINSIDLNLEKLK